MKIENEMTSNLVLGELGIRIKQYRINSQMTQAELSKKTGISLRNIVRIEKGEDTQFKNIIKILSIFHLQNNLDLIIPDETIRPLYKLDIKKRNRVRNVKVANDEKFVWGDEK